MRDVDSCYDRDRFVRRPTPQRAAVDRSFVGRRRDRVGMRWFVRGADARTGRDDTFEVVATSRDEATEEASRRGMYVESVTRVAMRTAASRRFACGDSPLSLVSCDVAPETVAVTSRQSPPTAAADVSVTPTRLVVAGRAYVLTPGTRASSATIRPDRSVVILFLLVGMMIAAAGGMLHLRDGIHAAGWTAILWVLSMALVGAGLMLAAVDRPRYAVRLEGSPGAVDAVVSGDRWWIASVVAAVNRAVTGRR
jgi:hypothetical protein